jgi:hypothetical protein
MGRAFQRINAATTDADFEDELSCLLHHFYRFSEFCWKRQGFGSRDAFYKWLHDSNDQDLRRAGAAIWARNFDTHDLVAVATPSDTYGDIYGDVYGAPRWKSLVQTEKLGRHLDYANDLKGREIVSTTRSAFDAIAALL